MRISNRPDLSALPYEAQIDAELLKLAHDQQETDGAATVQIIESAADLINRPLTEGHIGRRINIAV